MQQILVVEDEVAIADALLFALASEGFGVRHLALARDAIEAVKSAAPDLVILDVGLPDISGFEACRELRRFSAVPVMFLTARAEEIDRVVGFEIGADDYVVKPFSPREVVARARAIIRRSGAPLAQAPTGEFHVDADRLQIHYHGVPLKLTALEYRLLQQLLSQPERVQGREQLLAAVGIAQASGYERSIDTHIKALRAKLREVVPAHDPIHTHRGFGYSYQPSPAMR